MSSPRALEINDKVIALHNPRRELPRMFRQRAERLYYELEGHERDELSRAEPPEDLPDGPESA